MNLMKPYSQSVPRCGFTLIELLVVISIIGVLAAFVLGAIGPIRRVQHINSAKAELAYLETALENYKAKYGFYPPCNQNGINSYLPMDRSQFSQLYYELSGTTNNGTYYISPDGTQIKVADVNTAFGTGGFINCSKGGGEDVASAKNFLYGIGPKMIYNHVTNSGIATTMLVTSVGGPDDNYQPLNAAKLNPFRYVCPGINNPNSYDLWVQLSISSSFNGVNAFTRTNKYLICNWGDKPLKNSPQP